MKQHTKQTKRTYIQPQMELIELDHDISLTMNSLIPPFGPTEALMDPMAFSDEMISPLM